MIGSEWKKVELSTIGNGVATELFQRELQKVLENLADDDCIFDGKREISLNFSFKQNLDRSECSVLIQAKSKLTPVNAHASNITIVQSGPNHGAYTHDLKQTTFDIAGEDETVSKIGGKDD